MTTFCASRSRVALICVSVRGYNNNILVCLHKDSIAAQSYCRILHMLYIMCGVDGGCILSTYCLILPIHPSIHASTDSPPTPSHTLTFSPSLHPSIQAQVHHPHHHTHSHSHHPSIHPSIQAQIHHPHHHTHSHSHAWLSCETCGRRLR